jgi:hypothetical protein
MESDKKKMRGGILAGLSLPFFSIGAAPISSPELAKRYGAGVWFKVHATVGSPVTSASFAIAPAWKVFFRALTVCY